MQIKWKEKSEKRKAKNEEKRKTKISQEWKEKERRYKKISQEWKEKERRYEKKSQEWKEKERRYKKSINLWTWTKGEDPVLQRMYSVYSVCRVRESYTVNDPNVPALLVK